MHGTSFSLVMSGFFISTNLSKVKLIDQSGKHVGKINENRSFRPKSVSPQVVSPQLKVVSPQLRVVSPRLKVVSFKVICNVFTNYLRNKILPL